MLSPMNGRLNTIASVNGADEKTDVAHRFDQYARRLIDEIIPVGYPWNFLVARRVAA